jgi:hypothetical protein
MTAVLTPSDVRAARALRQDLSLAAKALLGLKLSRNQRKMLRIMSKPGTWLSVRTAHGIGKTHCAAALCATFLVTHPGSKVISTAPTGRQVRDLLWMEINTMVRNAPAHLGGECKTMRWDMEPGWFAVGIATKEPEQIQGRHGDHILFVLDEAAGIGPKIWLAVRTMTTGMDARCLAIGNPTRVTGDFAATFKDSRWQNLRISYREAPNVTGEMHIPGGCTAAWVEDMARKFGRDSAIFKSRCEAEFPDDDVSSIIPWSRVAAAMEPARAESALAVPPGGDLRMGVDVARFGRAYSVLTVRDGPRILERERYNRAATTETAGRVIAMAEKYLVEPECIAVDDTGVGGGCTDMLNEHFYPRTIRAFNFGAKADDEAHYDDAVTEIYWRLRDALDPERPDALALPAGTPEADDLANQLLRQYKLTSKGRMKMESKDDYQKRNPEGKSPDDADSLALTYAKPAVKAADIGSAWGDDKTDGKDKAALDAVFNRGASGEEDMDENEEGNPC